MSEYTENQLLEWAAKAAGYTSWGYDARDYPLFVIEGHPMGWNPLEDDGDALRLAVALALFNGDRFYHYRILERSSDPEGCELKNTRRAIVRAAAEIGRAMP